MYSTCDTVTKHGVLQLLQYVKPKTKIQRDKRQKINTLGLN